MEKFFELQTVLLQKGYSHIEMVAGGAYLIGLDVSGKVCVFDSNANLIDDTNNISIQKDPANDRKYKINIYSYQIDYNIDPDC